MKKLIMILAAGLTLIGVVAALAAAETSTDSWKPANTQFKVQSNDSSFHVAMGVINITDKCATFYLEGTTPMGSGTQGKFTEAEAQTGVDVTPVVGQCSVVETVVTGPWHIALHSQNSKAQCGASEEDPNAEDDCFTAKIPANGFKIKSAGCEVIAAANEIKGVYDDDFELQGKPNDKVGRVEFKETPISVTSGGNCTGITSGKFTGSFVIAGLHKEEPKGEFVQSGITDD